jgi:2-methylfumaryl-CoA hydratase
MPAEVKAEELVVAPNLDLSRYETWPSGGRAYFEDYEPGERIHHVDGMTIEEAEHMIATRLYQNTAKVHFDAHAAKSTRFGKRLIYGGHVISLARALSFNGLENALGILAINAGAHANPTFAGDTIYAYTEVLDRAELPQRPAGDLGAVRVRLVGVKNANPAQEEIPLRVSNEGKESYHPNVVLDLDMWLLMPKRRG